MEVDDGRTMSPMVLTDLPDELLVFLMEYCDLQSLGRLCRVSKRLQSVLRSECVWIAVKRRLTVVGRYSNRLTIALMLPAKEQVRIALNWRQGICRDSRLVHHRERQLPWMQLEGDLLYISYTNTISCYHPKSNGHLRKILAKTLVAHQDDVCRFTLRDGILVSGARDGSISLFSTETNERLLHYSKCHVGDVQSVDLHSDIVVSGSRDASVKVWRTTQPKQSEALLHTINVGDRVWSLALNPCGKQLSVGNAGINLSEPLHVWDIDRMCLLGALGVNYKRGAGVLDILYETKDVLLSCGYDTYIRLWDLRCPYTKSAVCWEEPYDSSLYCIQTDYKNTFLTGSSRHGMIHLWDKRKPMPVQMYYTGRTASPVYSLAFNHSRLYTALDQGINMLDFSIQLPDKDNCRKRNKKQL